MKWEISAKTCLAALLLALCLVLPAGATTITVDDDGPADFKNIQAAINDAYDGEVVEIKPGTYTGPGNYNIWFKGKAITVRGTNPEDFDVVAETVIDCRQQGQGFIFDNAEDANSILSGVKIINGYGNWPFSNGGGAISSDGASPIITNCILTYNTGSGGAISATGGYLTVRNCIITHNTSDGYGGGIYGTGQYGLTVENCIISHNVATGRGGAIRTTSADVPFVVKNCIITGNIAGTKGGGISSRGGYMMVSGCIIADNVAGELGGGIHGRMYARPAISNSIIHGNTAPVGPQIAVDEANAFLYGPPFVSVSYSNVSGGQSDVYTDGIYTIDWGPGNIDVDPCFADPGYWGYITDPNIHVEPNDPNTTWMDAGGDYHLKSQAGRWDADEREWTIDDVTSLCIDAGDPSYPISLEPFPNGGRINMGAYGATAEASKSYFNKPPCETIVAGDINGDCIVDGIDFAFLARKWLISDLEPPSPWRPGRATNPYPADGTVDPSIGWLGLTLTWQAGGRADSHDVYFGTVSPGYFRGNQTETEFFAGYPSTSGTYYWRIDEINTYGKTTGTVWAFSISPPAPASNPIPADGATGVCADRSGTFMLNWTAGDGAHSHNIYFGTVSPGQYKRNQTVSDTDFSLGPVLLSNTYFWRIDEVSGEFVTEGPVWSFTVEGPPPATNPYPADGAECNSMPQILSWQPGQGSETYDVYFGTVSPGDFQGSQTGTIFNPGSLKVAQTYYWRIDEIGSCGKTIGTVWSFRTPPPDPATQPYPADGSVYANTHVTLAWHAGSGAETHDVYFGTESPGEFQGNQAATTFTPSDLEAYKTYYWRIDEICGDGKTVGPVWTFTVLPPTQATNPYPADGATGVFPDSQGNYVLGWQPGNYTWGHDVYFGISSPGEYRGYFTVNTYNLGATLPFHTYYWRIDEVSGVGKTIGAVWTFRISPPDAATDPYPTDEATYPSASVTLSWQPGAGAQTHDVYFGTESPGQFQGNQTADTFRPGPLEAQKTYYWRIDEVNIYGKTTGPVWQFTCMPAR
ncbi:MAG: right-handed parallel beta-helix repeat-containing protein [Sedimentisphaerales bacterium]|nr:right-handed parallel beta-helix repeat-containing protein [Sedimentisphaerales bacterium]